MGADRVACYCPYGQRRLRFGFPLGQYRCQRSGLKCCSERGGRRLCSGRSWSSANRWRFGWDRLRCSPVACWCERT